MRLVVTATREPAGSEAGTSNMCRSTPNVSFRASSIYICVHEPLPPDEFRASSRPVVAYVPGVMFSGPVARGFETSAMPLRSPVLRLTRYRLAYYPAYLAYLVILLQEYPLCH